MCKSSIPTKWEITIFVLGLLSFMMFISGIFVGIFMTDGIRIMGLVFVMVGGVLTLGFFMVLFCGTKTYTGGWFGSLENPTEGSEV